MVGTLFFNDMLDYGSGHVFFDDTTNEKISGLDILVVQS